MKNGTIKVLIVCAVLLTIGLYQHFTFGKRAIPRILQALPFSSKWLGPPKGHTRAAEYKHSSVYIPIIPSYSIISSPFPLQQKGQISICFPEMFVLKLKQGRVLGRNGAVITPNDRLLADVSIEWISSIKDHSLFCKNKLPPVVYTEDTIAVIASKSGDCYFHWMFDVLPRLELLKRAGIPYDKIYLNPLKHPFQKESFTLLNLDPEKVIWAGKRQHIEAKELIVPSVPSVASIPLWVCDFLRKTFLLKQVERRNKKIYISRKGASWRKILNEAELFSSLEKLGFEEVLLEKLSIQEQAELFASAECIVAPHGAGLTNLVFCEPGTKVIEIFSPEYLNGCYFRLCDQQQLPYHPILGSQENLSPENKAKHDVIVSIESVLNYL